jgi:dsRNA-specific ribonuclease
MQAVEEKLQEKQASEWCRCMSVVEFLISITNTSTGWSCMDHPKSVADVFEALLGASFVDSGEDFVTAFNVRTTRTCMPRNYCSRQRQSSYFRHSLD